MKSIGVIGLGIIGGAWARRYHAAGKLAGTWNRSPKPEAPKWNASLEALVEAADFLQIVVADPPAVEGLLTRMLPKLGPGKYVIQSSTIDPASSLRFQKLVRSTGAHYVEAPFTGSKPAAEEGKTVFFLGADAEDIKMVEPLLRLISETRFVIGTGQQAATVKLAMNLNLAAQMEAFCESLTLVRRAGISDETYFSVLAKNASQSGLAKMKEAKLKEGNFDPQFSVKHMFKDMRLASASAGGHEYPILETVRKRLQAADAEGYGNLDYCILIKLLEKKS
jgi:3-hydroxyisobutyrate dehydrogenase-like beta-hydroxyacid dehydrogenase